jgi:hypothetical protein
VSMEEAAAILGSALRSEPWGLACVALRSDNGDGERERGFGVLAFWRCAL